MPHHFSSYKAFFQTFQNNVWSSICHGKSMAAHIILITNETSLHWVRHGGTTICHPQVSRCPIIRAFNTGTLGVQSLARPPKRFLLKLINLIFTSWPIWSSPNPIFIGNLTGVPLCLNAILLMAHFSATFATMLTAVWYQI